MAGILQAIQPRLAQVHGAVVVVHHLAGLELFTAQADHQGFAAQIGVARQVAHGADGNVGIRRRNRHAAAVAVGQRHHVIDMRVLGQQLVLDALDRMVQHAGNALHGGGNAEDVARAHGAVRIAIALEGKPLQGRLGFRHLGGQRQAVQRRCGGHAQLVLLHPTATRNRRQGITDGLAVANNLAALGDVFQRHLVALRDEIHGDQAVGKLGTGGYPLIVHHDHHIVALVQTDRARRVGMFNQLHHTNLRNALEKGWSTQGPG